MKNQNTTDSVRAPPLPAPESAVVKIRTEQSAELDTRSKPLESTYNSTFIIVVLSIAVILAIILLIWPAGGF